jgi:hypothetical protein
MTHVVPSMPSHPLVFRSIPVLPFIKVKVTTEQATKALWGSRCILVLFLTMRLEMGVGGQRHALVALPTGKTRYPLCKRRLGPRAGLNGCGKSRPPPPGFDPRTVQPVFILSLSLPSGVFPSGVPTTTLYTVLFFAIRVTCSAYLISHYFITAVVHTWGPVQARIEITACYSCS